MAFEMSPEGQAGFHQESQHEKCRSGKSQIVRGPESKPAGRKWGKAPQEESEDRGWRPAPRQELGCQAEELELSALSRVLRSHRRTGSNG